MFSFPLLDMHMFKERLFITNHLITACLNWDQVQVGTFQMLRGNRKDERSWRQSEGKDRFTTVKQTKPKGAWRGNKMVNHHQADLYIDRLHLSVLLEITLANTKYNPQALFKRMQLSLCTFHVIWHWERPIHYTLLRNIYCRSHQIFCANQYL